jgi:2-desacetyl-2-hydroxyethyl bacteriochlorophyllide A dehydrogenase
MRATQMTATGSVEIGMTDPPALAPGEVRIEVTYCGICGSDLHMLDYAEHMVGHTLGHEFAGTIVEVAADASDWSVGDRVTAMPIAECGECEACTDGLGVCAPGLMLGPGLGRPGGLAETVVVPTGMLFKLPDGVNDMAGALVEPLAVAVRGIERSAAQPEDRVVVLGGGPIGYMTVLVLQARQTKALLVVEPNASRADRVRELGVPVCSPDDAADAAVRELGGAPRVVIDCTGHHSGGSLGISLLPQNGRLAVVGVTAAPVSADFMSVTTKELTIVGSLAYNRGNFAEALDHLAAGRIPIDKIVTSVKALDEVDGVMKELLSGRSSDVKVLVKP